MTDSFGLLEFTQDAYELTDPKRAAYMEDLEDRLDALERRGRVPVNGYTE